MTVRLSHRTLSTNTAPTAKPIAVGPTHSARDTTSSPLVTSEACPISAQIASADRQMCTVPHTFRFVIADAADGMSSLQSLVHPFVVVLTVVAVLSLLIAANTWALVKKSRRSPSLPAIQTVTSRMREASARRA